VLRLSVRPATVIAGTLVAGSAFAATSFAGEPPRSAEVAVASKAEARSSDAAAANQYSGFEGYARKVTTDSPEAQRWFDQGIQLLYGYNHDEAIRSFEKAAEIDPSCAMAWWGSAYARGLHINKPEMAEEQSKLAYAAAQKAVAAIDDETPAEQSLVKAVASRYAMPVPADRKPLDLAYADAMEAAWHAHPEDADIGALFAESLMNLQPWDLWTSAGAPKGRALEIVAVLERTMARHPKHPGANHFYIHAVEASSWPERATPAADRLVDLVPGSGHLVHMPSHVFIRTGRYAEAADANERAIAADEAYFATSPAPDFYSIYFLHNLHFLAYAAMMEGRYETALAAAEKIERTVPPDFLKKYVAVADGFMPTKTLVMIRFGKWDEVLDLPEPPEWRLLSRAERHFARSVANSALGRTKEARKEIDLLDELTPQLTDEWKMGNNPARDIVAIARTMAEGELAFREDRTEEAFELLREAVRLEENLAYDEPPGWMQPVRHALGALLLADGQAAEAEAVYRADLVRHPNNAWALLGLQQSLEAQKRTTDAEALAETLAKAWSRADVKPVASCYCHPAARGDGTCCEEKSAP
jgi:tetratricopeptide (TPR) repeat protein